MKKGIMTGVVLCVTVMLLFGCGDHGSGQSAIAADTQTNDPEEITYDDHYDPSVENYIWYARALGEGYKKDFYSEQVVFSSNTTVFIGDSFFDARDFWTNFYSKHYPNQDVFLAGIGRTTAQDWIYLIDTVFAGFKENAPKNIVVHLGTNDLGDGSVTSQDVRWRLTNLFEALHKKFPDTSIYYFGITHRADGSAKEHIDEVNDKMQDWCLENSGYMTYVDTPSKITAEALKDDGLHPKLETYAVFVQALQEAGCEIIDK